MANILEAYVLITTIAHKEEEIQGKVRKIQGVIETTIVHSEFNMLIKVRASSFHELDKVITTIRKTEDILQTKTLICDR